MQVLVLDDDLGRIACFADHFAKHGIPVAFARTAGDAIKALAADHWDYVYLDHDLGLTPVPDPGTGMQVVQWILEQAKRGRFRQTRFVVHSLNPVDGPRMARRLHKAGLHLKYRPAVWERMV